ncbi:centromere-specific histone H3 CENP-A [Crenichthys baileyi]|uniref:Centromere-specific histone H3 CENP-A n=1 Tax=Crenichthys baileyi TaxID=28760 RepID=A0AAV9S1M5_9TELE
MALTDCKLPSREREVPTSERKLRAREEGNGEEPVRGEDTQSSERKQTLAFRFLQPECFPVLLSALIIPAAMLRPVLLCATLLLLTPFEITEARALHPAPDAAQFLEQFLERYDDLLTLEDLENLLNSQPEERSTASSSSSGVKAAEYPKWADVQMQPETPWLRLLKGALTSQRQAEPERSRRGWNRGCFGLKLDRIGSMSGLGC